MKNQHKGWGCYAIASFLVLALATLPCIAGDAPFYPRGTYNKNITSPDDFLGFPLGQRPVRYDEVARYIMLVASQSSRVTVKEIGETYERRKQYLLTITSEENQKRIEEIRNNNLKIADRRNTENSELNSIIEKNPAIVWIGYGIHGDELSSVDAAMQIIYQLSAGTDEATLNILSNLAICLDPMENPDGRERWLAQMQQWAGAVMNTDGQSLSHYGVWPYGRTNHYLFDMNRDWIALENIENQNRIRMIHKWYPQLLIDSHEMGSFDTYLFSPPRAPFNPNIASHVPKWWGMFAADQSKAFDAYGWSYYTREWNDEWFPGYGSSYCLYLGGIGILYEQAGTDGSAIKRPDGTVLTYREAVHHHVVSSFTNFLTAANNRKELLADYAEARKPGEWLKKNEAKTYLLLNGENPTRTEALVEKLLLQNIEVYKAEEEFRVEKAVSYWNAKPALKRFPAGTYVVSLDQPNGRLAKAILEFDPRMTNDVLKNERESLEKDKDSKMYDVSAWSLPVAYGLEAYSTTEGIRANSKRVKEFLAKRGSVVNSKPAYGYLLEYADDRAVLALAKLLEEGYRARVARYDFAVEGKAYPASTVLLRVNENDSSLAMAVQRIAEATGVTFTGVSTALSAQGPDLGGNDFIMLLQPRIALLAGPEISTNSFGTIWKLLDEQMKIRISVLHTATLNNADLKKYNVIVIPSAEGGSLARSLGKGGIGTLRDWVDGGGTLIGVGGAASFLADSSNDMSKARIRQQTLKELDIYAKAVEMEEKAQQQMIDSVSIWEGTKPAKEATKKGEATPGEKEIAMEEERGRLFMPRGAMMRVELNNEHWLSYGAGEKATALVFSSLALMAKDPVETAARFSDYETIRVAGLVWPEARARWAKTAYATREGKGNGQLILFANEPNFRGFFHGTERMLLNAIFLGPGFGSDHPVGW